MRANKALKNIFWGFVYEAANLISAFIIPKLILEYFGSDYNGITNVIIQFLRVITLLQAGIGGVAIAALFKPLEEKDNQKLSSVIKTTESYLRKVAFIFIGIALIIAGVLPLFVKEFDYFFTASLVLIMSFATFIQYFFGQTYLFLFSADQKQKIMHILNTAKLLLNTFISAILIKLGFGIHFVQVGAAVIYVIAPIFLYIYANRKYEIDKTAKKDVNLLEQRWDSFGIQIASFVTANISLIAISIFLSMTMASIFTTYNFVFAALTGLINPFVSAIYVAFGNMMVRKETELLKKSIRIYEQIIFSLATFLCGVTAAVIFPYMGLYTRNISDTALYYQPVFAYIMVAASLFGMYQLPYTGVCVAAGHFRQMRNPAILQAFLSICISILLTFLFGIIGTAIGILFAHAFRAIQYSTYVSQNIIKRSIGILIKRIGLSFFICVIIARIPYILAFSNPETWLGWIKMAVIVSIIAMPLILVVENIFYKEDFIELLKIAKSALKGNSVINNNKRRISK